MANSDRIDYIIIYREYAKPSNKSEQNQVLNGDRKEGKEEERDSESEKFTRSPAIVPPSPPAKWSIIYLCKHDVNERVRGKYKQISVSLMRALSLHLLSSLL